MRKAKKFLFFIVFFNYYHALADSKPSNPGLTSISERLIREVDEYVLGVVDEEKIVGLSYAVLINGKTVHKNSFGYKDFELQIPITMQTPVPIASITKVFVSSAVHDQLLKNHITFDEPIGTFLLNIPEHWKSITIKELLSHTSGLPDYYPINPTPASMQTAIKTVDNLPFEFKTGQKSDYNQTGFLLLRMLVEHLSGQSLDKYLQSSYFDKLGLLNTYFGQPANTASNASKTYRVSWNNIQPFEFRYPPAVFGSAGISASLEDLIAWMTALANGKVLSETMLERILAGVPLKNGNSADFSLGWELHETEKVTWIGHGGANTSEVRHYIYNATRDSITVIWLSNTLGYDPHNSVNKIASFFMKDVEQCKRFLLFFSSCSSK